MQKSLMRHAVSVAVVLALTGCSALEGRRIGKDLDVLKTQLAQQQSQMAQQQVLLEAMMASREDVASEHRRRFGALDSQLNELLNQAKSEQRGFQQTPMTCPNISVTNGGSDTNLTRIGALEVIHIQPPGRRFAARIDTGANTSSLDARNIEMFESDGEDYVRFNLPPSILADDQKQRYELPVSRFVRIIQAGKEEERRAVVELKVSIGGIERLAEFTLTDRDHLTYRALIGRNILKDFFIVDVANRFLISDRSASQETDASEQSDEDNDNGDEEELPDDAGERT